MSDPKNPNITYATFKIGEHCGKLGYDAAEKIRQDLHFLSRAYGFFEDESSRIDRMNVLLNHIDYAHKCWNRQSATPQPLSGQTAQDVMGAVEDWEYLLGEISAAGLILNDGVLDNINAALRSPGMVKND